MIGKNARLSHNEQSNTRNHSVYYEHELVYLEQHCAQLRIGDIMTGNTLYITLGQAARLCGWSKGRLSKALKSGEMSYISKDKAGYQLDPAEVMRVFPKKPREYEHAQSETELYTDENSDCNMELEVLREQVKTANVERERERLLLNQQISDLKSQHREQIELYRERLNRADREKDQLTALLSDCRVYKHRPWWKVFGG